MISSLHVDALVVAAIDKTKSHWKKERRSSRLVGTTIQHEGPLEGGCYKASHKLNAVNGEVRVELLANGTSLLSRESDVGKGVITLVSAAKTMANELTLYRLDGFDDVVGTGICHVLRSLLRGSSINEKLTLAAIAGVGAEDGIGSHWSWEGEARASEQKNNNCRKGARSPLFINRYKAQACSIRLTQ